MNKWEFFNSVFSYDKLRDSSLTDVLVFVMLYLKLNENIDQMHESRFLSYLFIGMSLVMSSIQSHDTNSHFWISIVIFP